MSNFRRLLTDLRRVLTGPSRRLRIRRMCAQGKAPISVLFYHRVADSHPNGWTIPTAMFEAQMDWIRDRFDVIDMQELQRRCAGKQVIVPPFISPLTMVMPRTAASHSRISFDIASPALTS
ncbi:MAG: hypothetical protein R3C05_16035 [Pirellulaceae bacterium]